VIEKFKDEMDFSSGFNDKKEQQALAMLNLHIKLLCELNPTQVLPNLKKIFIDHHIILFDPAIKRNNIKQS
jgi:hypothetical protein